MSSQSWLEEALSLAVVKGELASGSTMTRATDAPPSRIVGTTNSIIFPCRRWTCLISKPKDLFPHAYLLLAAVELKRPCPSHPSPSCGEVRIRNPSHRQVQRSRLLPKKLRDVDTGNWVGLNDSGTTNSGWLSQYFDERRRLQPILQPRPRSQAVLPNPKDWEDEDPRALFF